MWRVEAMVRLYHGTTEESCRSILANGFSHNAVVWTCSDPDMMYFYDQGMVAPCGRVRQRSLSPAPYPACRNRIQPHRPSAGTDGFPERAVRSQFDLVKVSLLHSASGLRRKLHIHRLSFPLKIATASLGCDFVLS